MSDPPRDVSRSDFATTHWSLVLRASGAGEHSGQALASLCETYWLPVYVFVRRQGCDADDALDLTQEFFLRLIEKDYLKAADPSRGRFRAFLLASVRHFLSNERRRDRAVKRGGGRPNLPLEFDGAEGRFQTEGRHELTPERLFDRHWALLLLDRALARLRDRYLTSGKAETFDVLKEFLTPDGSGSPYADVARALGVTEGAVKVSIHRLRRQFRDCLVAEIGQTVSDPCDVAGEIRYLLDVISS